MDWDAGVDNPRTFDMVQLDDWENQIVFDVTKPYVVLPSAQSLKRRIAG